MQSATAIPVDRLLGIGPRDAVALIHRDRYLNYAELNELVGRVAGGLAATGVRPGDRVVTWLPKSIEAVTTLFAAARAGAVFVPANPQLKAAQVAHIAADSEARLVLTTAGRAEGLAVPAPLLTIEADWPGLATASPLAVERSPADLAALLYTSGSTGQPKGVMLSHSNLWHAADAVRTLLGTRPHDRVLSVLPHGFDYGLNQLTQAWAAGASAVLLDYLAPRDVVRAVAAHGITQLGGVPPLWHDLADAEWGAAGATLRTLTNSGGHLHAALSARLHTLFPQAHLHLMYGLTEAFRATSLDPALAAVLPDSVGTAIPHAEVMVVGADGQPAAVGEMVQAGPLVAQGYWRDPQRTAQRFRPAPSWSRRGGTAVWSGDTVRLDQAGRLSFVGRDDEMIKTGGYRVSPTEIEDAALAAGARGAVAVGVPDARAGQAIVLFAVADDAATLADALRRALPGYMQPARIELRDALPVLANGKLDRAALKAAA